MRFYLIDRRSPDSDAKRAAAREAMDAAMDAAMALDLESKQGRRKGLAALKDAKEQHRRGCRLCSLESLMWGDVITRLRDLLGITTALLIEEARKHGRPIH